MSQETTPSLRYLLLWPVAEELAAPAGDAPGASENDALRRLRDQARALLIAIHSCRDRGHQGDNAYWVLDADADYIQALASWRSNTIRLEVAASMEAQVGWGVLGPFGFRPADQLSPNPWRETAVESVDDLDDIAVVTARVLAASASVRPPASLRWTLAIPGQPTQVAPVSLTARPR